MDKEVNISQGNGKTFNSSDDEEPNAEDFKVGGRDRASESDIMGSSDAEGTISRRNKGRLTSSESESDEKASDAVGFDEKDINDVAEEGDVASLSVPKENENVEGHVSKNYKERGAAEVCREQCKIGDEAEDSDVENSEPEDKVEKESDSEIHETGSTLEGSSSEEEEDEEDYCRGGYHPINTGDFLNERLKVVGKLGWGNFSTVWQCKDQVENSQVAVKVNKSHRDVTEMAEDEIKLLKCIGKASTSHPGSKHVLRLVEHFEVEGPNGRHVCLSLQLLGYSLLRCYKPGQEGMPLEKVKEVMNQVMLGLDFLHTKAKIIHTDIKPENILLSEPGAVDLSSIGGSLLKVKIGDLGSACWTTKRFSVSIGTREYRAPEALLGVEDYGTEVDVWAAACTAFELATGEYLFKPKEREEWSRDEDHLLRITELVGHLPKAVIKAGFRGPTYYEGSKLKNIDQGILRPYSLFQVLVEQLEWRVEDALGFSGWLLPMLATNPQARVTAAQSAQHSFLEPLDKEVEEKELQVGSQGCEPEREASLENGSDCKGEIADLDERLCKLEFSLVEEVSQLKNKLVEEAELNAAATTRLSKLEMEISRLKNKKQNEEGQVDELKQKVENLERRCNKLKSSESISLSKVEAKVSELKTQIEVTGVEVEEIKQSLALFDGKVESALETMSSCEKRITKIETEIEEVKIEKVESKAVIELREKADCLEQLCVSHQESNKVGLELDERVEERLRFQEVGLQAVQAEIEKLKSSRKELKKLRKEWKKLSKLKLGEKNAEFLMEEILKLKTEYVEVRRQMKEVRGTLTTGIKSAATGRIGPAQRAEEQKECGGSSERQHGKMIPSPTAITGGDGDAQFQNTEVPLLSNCDTPSIPGKYKSRPADRTKLPDSLKPDEKENLGQFSPGLAKTEENSFKSHCEGGDLKEVSFSYRKPMTEAVPVIRKLRDTSLDEPGKKSEKSGNDKNRRERSPAEFCYRYEAGTSRDDGAEKVMKVKKSSRGKKSKNSGENDPENNCSVEEGIENGEVQKHPLSVLMQMKLSENMEKPVEKPIPLEAKAARSELVADDGPTSTQLVISNITLPSAIDAQMKLLKLVKRTCTLVKYKFYESGSRCWLQVASEEQAFETHVALDGLLWYGKRLKVQKSMSADEVTSEKKGRLLKYEASPVPESKMKSCKLRMEEEGEKQKKRKREREESTEDRNAGQERGTLRSPKGEGRKWRRKNDG